MHLLCRSLASQKSYWCELTYDVGAVLQPSEPPKPTLRAPTAKQQRSIANGNALQLVELWKAAFVGSTLDKAGQPGTFILVYSRALRLSD